MMLGRVTGIATLRRRRWQRDYSQLCGDGYGSDEDFVTGAGSGVSSGVASSGRTAQEAIFIGVATGVLVWCITRALDKVFGGEE